MSLQKNFAVALRAIKERQGKSFAEFSEELSISRSILQNYVNGNGNPTLGTIDAMAQQLEINPTALVSDVFSPTQLDIVLLFLNTIREFTDLDDKQKLRIAEKLLEIVQIASHE